MRISFALAVLTAAQAGTSQGGAQPSPQPIAVAPAQPRAVILSPPTENVLRAGVEIPLRLEEGLDSNDKTVHEGQKFRLSVASDVTLGTIVVIPAGSPAIGEVVEVRRKGMWGKSGRIVGRVLSVRVGDRTVRLTGRFDDKGVTGTAGVVGSLILVPFAGFFMTGSSAKILPGSGVKAFLDEDLRIVVPQ
jgi:hypothetical protein